MSTLKKSREPPSNHGIHFQKDRTQAQGGAFTADPLPNARLEAFQKLWVLVPEGWKIWLDLSPVVTKCLRLEDSGI